MADLTYSSTAGGWVVAGTNGPTVTPTANDDLAVPSGNLEISANLKFRSLTIGTTENLASASVIVDEGVTLTGDVTVHPGSHLQLGNNTVNPSKANPAVLDGSLTIEQGIGSPLVDAFLTLVGGVANIKSGDVEVYSGSVTGAIFSGRDRLTVFDFLKTPVTSLATGSTPFAAPGSALELDGSTTTADLVPVFGTLAENNFVVEPEQIDGGTVQIASNIDNTASTLNLIQSGNAQLVAVFTGQLAGGTLISSTTSVIKGYELSGVALRGAITIPTASFDLASNSLSGTAVVDVAGQLLPDSSTFNTTGLTFNVSGVIDASAGFNAISVTYGTGTVINLVQGGKLTFDPRFNNSMVLQGDLNVIGAATPYTAPLTNPIGTVQFATGSAVTVGGLATLDITSALDNETTVQLDGGSLEIDEAPGTLGTIQFFAPNSALQIGTASSIPFAVIGSLRDFSNTDTVLFPSITYGAAAHVTLTGNSLLVFDQSGVLDATFSLSRDDSQTYSDKSFVLGPSSAGMTLTTQGITPLVAPIITPSSTASFTGGGSSVALDPGIALSDAASTTLATATVSIGTNFTGDTLNFTNQNGITGSFNQTTGVLSLSGVASLTNYQTALQSITYSFPLNSDPTAGGGLTSRTISWVANDGAVSSLATTSTLNVADAVPVLTAGASVSYSEGSLPAVADSAVTVSDPNSPTLAGASVAITGGTFANDGDLLSADTIGTAITSFYNPLNETLFLSGTDMLAAYQEVLRTVAFVSGGADPTNGGTNATRTLSWTANNGVTDATPVTSTIMVQPSRSMTWTGAASTNFGDENNWNDITDSLNPAASAPGSADVAGFTSGGGIIGGTGAADWLGFGGSTQWTVPVGASLNAAGGAVVGITGAGRLLLQGGIATGIVATGNPAQGFGIAPAPGGTGDVEVAGNTALLTNTGSFIVGDLGAGSLEISAGATVSSTGEADIGLNVGATGAIDIEGAGSRLNIAGDLDIGDRGTGVLTMGANTELTVADAINVGSQGMLAQSGGMIDPVTLTIQEGGSAGGSGAETYAVETLNSGTLLADGTLTVTAPLITLLTTGEDGALDVRPSSDLILNVASVDSSQTVSFDDGTGMLTIGTPSGFAATIGSFTSGDTIVMDGVSIASQSFDAGTHVLSLFNGSKAEVGTLQFADTVSNVTGLVVTGSVLCFMAGTRISTERGEIAVEDLLVGDEVHVLGPGLGAQPVIWLGHRAVDCSRHPSPRKVWPVRVITGAFGPGRPARDLFLSRDHAVFVHDVLIPVKYLENGTTIAQVPVDEVTYYHVELPHHAVLLAEGLPAESYLNTGDRSNFGNRSGPVRLHPDFSARVWEVEGYAQIVVTGPELAAVRRWVETLATSTLRTAASAAA